MEIKDLGKVLLIAGSERNVRSCISECSSCSEKLCGNGENSDRGGQQDSVADTVAGSHDHL